MPETTPAPELAAARPDLAEIERLVAALEVDLARARAGSQNVEALRSEVEALRAALGSGGASIDAARMKHVHTLIDGAVGTLEVDAVKVSDYATQIGRILGFL